ncbi:MULTISPECIES: recombinase family protein [Corynebacterium]|uniref:recombinase family protein n=1 Tax=Corynebacterium TaxID=1716 RepID=UPI000B34B444|nr:recombinase family protein [Corynebacterium urinipleomorphum]QVI97661.1 recombinase family protein [Corynebacterium diphtheriae]
MKIGYARVSTEKQDLEAQRLILTNAGVADCRIYFDHGVSGRDKQRPGLKQAMAACRSGDTLVVTKLDRLARSVHDASEISEHLQAQGVALQIGAEVYDPTVPTGKLLFNVLAMVAEFEADLISARTREGMAIAKRKGRLRGKPPKLTPKQQDHVYEMYQSGNFTQAEIAELMGVSDRTIRRIVKGKNTA